jgi:hypothetical protein
MADTKILHWKETIPVDWNDVLNRGEVPCEPPANVFKATRTLSGQSRSYNQLGSFYKSLEFISDSN